MVIAPSQPKGRWLKAETVLQLATLVDAAGGIGLHSFERGGVPCCLYGMAATLDGKEPKSGYTLAVAFDQRTATTPVMRELQRAGVTWNESDYVVSRMLREDWITEKVIKDRVQDFEAYLALLGVKIRGVDE